MSSQNGYIGSLALHLAVIGVAVLLANLAPSPVEDVRGQDPLLLEVWTGDGSERDPGIPGRAHGIADGSRTGDKSGRGAGGFRHLKTFNADKVLKEIRENEAKAAADAAEDAKADKAAPSDKSAVKNSSKSETLDEFRKTTGKTGKTSGGHAGKTGSGKASGASGIAGASVGDGNGKGSGKAGFGNPGGKGQNGGDGGSGNAKKLFVGDVKSKLQAAYGPLFQELGAELSTDKDNGVVIIRVSSSGLVSFAGWDHRPSDPLVEQIVQKAILVMRPVRPPPGGGEATVYVDVSGSVDE